MAAIPAGKGPHGLIVVGLLGGVASGKSLVGGQLVDLGGVLLDADRAGHAVLTEPAVIAEILSRWGEGVLTPSGQVDRRQLADLVFSPTENGRQDLAELERVTHPRIGERLREEMDQAARAGTRVVVLDAPVMLKAGWDRWCDWLVYIDTPRAERQRRACQRGWTVEQFAAREGAQEPLDEKRRRCQITIDNSGPPEQTRRQVEQFWQNHLSGSV